MTMRLETRPLGAGALAAEILGLDRVLPLRAALPAGTAPAVAAHVPLQVFCRTRSLSLRSLAVSGFPRFFGPALRS